MANEQIDKRAFLKSIENGALGKLPKVANFLLDILIGDDNKISSYTKKGAS